MPSPSLIIHERIASWSRQLRPRFQGWPIRWSETRSTPDLLRASAGSTCPIIVLEVDGRPSRGLDDLGAALQVAPGALSLVIDPRARPEVAMMARELGATLVLSGVVVPPEVEGMIRRWIPLAGLRAEAAGWSPAMPPDPEPWDLPEITPTPTPTT